MPGALKYNSSLCGTDFAVVGDAVQCEDVPSSKLELVEQEQQVCEHDADADAAVHTSKCAS